MIKRVLFIVAVILSAGLLAQLLHRPAHALDNKELELKLLGRYQRSLEDTSSKTKDEKIPVWVAQTTLTKSLSDKWEAEGQRDALVEGKKGDRLRCSRFPCFENSSKVGKT